MKIVARNKQIHDALEQARHSRMMAGPDGDSLLCGKCGDVNYVTPATLGLLTTVKCPRCNEQYGWQPEYVICAAPTHNDPVGCGSSLCWKRRSDLL